MESALPYLEIFTFHTVALINLLGFKVVKSNKCENIQRWCYFFLISRDVMEVLEINNFLKSPVFLYKCQEQELKPVLSISVVVGNRFCTVMLKN